MIPLFKVNMTKRPELIHGLNAVLRSGYIGEGEEVVKFEQELRDTIGCIPKPIAVNSCTSAIYLSLLSLGVGPGDEVITTPLTCTATNAPIVLLGARPVWADVEPFTGNIRPESTRNLITPRTKAVIAVDWTGRPCDYAALHSFGLPIIQDAAHGPIYDRWNCGSVTCLSFGPIKHLTSGDGGAIIINRPHQFSGESLRLLRWYGLDRTSSKNFRCEQDIKKVGGKFHMNNINAAIGRANLPELRTVVTAHRQNAYFYQETIKNPRILRTAISYLSNYWVYPIICQEPLDREKLQAYLKNHGIDSSPVHARNDKHTGFNFPGPELLGLDYFDSRQLNIPCGPWVTHADREHIAQVLNNFEGE